MSQRINFHQAIFGYRRGHELIASSLQFNLDEKLVLTRASDLSGSTPPVGFRQVFTGFPLGVGRYVLMSTWPANEMPRPGCVWTHALFIDFADLAEIEDLGIIRTYFVRPTLSDLDVSILPELGFAQIAASGARRFETEGIGATIKSVLSALYETDRDVLVSTPENEFMEDASFGLWSQQWPRLRRSFRFSTGSFSDRKSNVGFDLQVTPERNLSYWDLTQFKHISTERRFDEDAEWLSVASSDLIDSSSSSSFRSFLKAYGVDALNPRSSFEILAQSFLAFAKRPPNELSEQFIRVLREHPKAEDLRELKQHFISGISEQPSVQDAPSLLSVLECLIIEDQENGAKNLEIDFDVLIGVLVESHFQRLTSMLVRKPLSKKRWTELAAAIARKLIGGRLEELWTNSPELLPVMIRLNPLLGLDVATWRLPESAQWRVVEVLESISHSDVEVRRILVSMIEAGTTIGAAEISRLCPSSLYPAIVESNDFGIAFALASPVWINELGRISNFPLPSEPSSDDEVVLRGMFNPRQDLSSFRDTFVCLAKSDLTTLRSQLRVPAAFLLVVSVLESPSLADGFILGRGFIHAHKALEGSVEPPSAWRQLAPLLPEGWLWEEWDRCKRLRKGVKKWLKRNPKEAKRFVSSARSDAERDWLHSLT